MQNIAKITNEEKGEGVGDKVLMLKLGKKKDKWIPEANFSNSSYKEYFRKEMEETEQKGHEICVVSEKVKVSRDGAWKY